MDARRIRQACTTKVVACFVVLAVVVAIIIAVSLTQSGELPDPPSDRIECPGFSGKSDCTKHGCRYEHVAFGPHCYLNKDDLGYEAVEYFEQEVGQKIRLRSRQKETPYGDSIPNVLFEVIPLTNRIVRIKLYDADRERYEVPVQQDFPLLKEKLSVNSSDAKYSVTTTNETGIFAFQIQRIEDKAMLFDSRIGGLILSNQYLQVAGYLPSHNVYGLGENVHPTFRHDMRFKTWPLFSRDRPPVGGRTNHYGVHPFYTCLENTAKSHAVLLLNSNAMDVSLLPAPAISFRTTGGILDFFFFIGNDPEHVIELYTSLIGRPQLPPYWSLGFQISRYGYGSLTEVKKVIERTRTAAIPHEVQFLDIDHMSENLDFTYDEKNFAGLPEYIEQTKKEYGLKWIIILDPAIANASSYEPYKSGLASNVFIKRAPYWNASSMFPLEVQNENVTYGRVWPSTIVAFPDFFLNSTRTWWEKNIVTHHKTIPFDGLWIDMNEPSNFGTNEKKPFYCVQDDPCWALKCPHSPTEDPPYNPNRIDGDRLSAKTLCMDSIQGPDEHPYLHYDVHSLYGWSQTEPTLKAAETATERRSLVISRSTYPSSGRHTGHWLGDNRSTFRDMMHSVIGIMEFNLFGIPYIGADVCGFFLDTSEELCARWMQLGAFYPFFRNHNGMNQKDQDPGVLEEWALKMSRRAVMRRYHLRPYLYTLFYKAHVHGSTVIRPLHHEFPFDENTWSIDTQFMWGKHLLITPVLIKENKNVIVYLPKAEWWYFQYQNSRLESVSEGNITHKVGPEHDIPLHVRAGFVLPIEEYEFGKYDEHAGQNISLYIFPDADNGAFGDIFIDDGFSKNTIDQNNFILYQFKYKSCALNFTSAKNEYKGPKPFLHRVHVFRSGDVANVDIVPNANVTFKVDAKTKALSITINQKMEDVAKISWADSQKKCQVQ